MGSRKGLVSAVEVCGGPASAPEFKARSGEFLHQCILAALGALRQRLVAHLLKKVLFKAAVSASISVDRHGMKVWKVNVEETDYKEGKAVRLKKSGKKAAASTMRRPFMSRFQ